MVVKEGRGERDRSFPCWFATKEECIERNPLFSKETEEQVSATWPAGAGGAQEAMADT